jgi:xanthine/uracil permease
MDPKIWIRWVLGGVQWLFFMLTNTVVIPLSIGAAFHQAPPDVAASVQRSFLLTGLACLVQGLVGHRLPLMEGQSGLWWGVILSLNVMAATQPGASLETLGGSIEVGIMAAGLAVFVFGGLGMGRLLQRWFTPVVMTSFLFLLGVQLTTIFLKGMLGLINRSTIDPRVAGLSLMLVILVVILNVKGKGLLSNLALLIGMTAGWGVYSLWLPPAETIGNDTAPLLDIFPLGKPAWNVGVILTCVLAGLLNTTNTAASLKGSEPLFGKTVTDGQYRRSFMLSGLNAVIAGWFGLVPYAPYTSSLGFLRSTRILDRAPFLIGASLFTLLGAVPPLSRFFSTMPIAVGDAVLFAAYVQLFGSALQNIEGTRFDYRTVYRIAGPVLTGIAIMNIPPAAFGPLPGWIRPLAGNGLLIGILLALLLENTIRWEKLLEKHMEEGSNKAGMLD